MSGNNIIKNIYITHDENCEALVPYITQAVTEIMDAFPQAKNYNKYFPIVNLGNWKDRDYLSAGSDGSYQLEAYKSIQWYIERAKMRARLDHRWEERGQISIDQLYQDLSNDPYAKKIPQYSLLITSHDLYGTAHDGNLLNFCNGVTHEGHFAIVSAARFINEDNSFDIERFQTVVMHEFGHLIGLTPDGRKDTYQELGTHCANGDIMEQDMSGTGRKMTENRLRRKRMGLKPICDDCIEAGCRFLDREIVNHHMKMRQMNNRLQRQ